jgi:alpha-glucosidase
MSVVKKEKDWWKSAVFYQIYPRSYFDSNADGVGDLEGITEKLPYIKELGVDAIWISPFFQSPMKDFGYDVSDYRAIDPLFGDMGNFDKLLNTAHRHNLKIMIDLVLSHTSDQHEWYLESRENKTNDKADWYVWADPKADGSPPNNWLSVFGGPAWTFETRRGQYYLHNFLKEQPDLNFHNVEVQDALLDMCKFWLDKGVDGFRLDAINHGTHSKGLEDNPAKSASIDAGIENSVQFESTYPYNMQSHVYDKSQPENLDFLRRVRALTDEYDEVVLLGEIGDDHPYLRTAEYTSGGDLLHTAYNTHLISGERKKLDRDLIKTPIETEHHFGKGETWPSWAFSNHDVVRVFDRWGRNTFSQNPNYKKMLIALLLSLRGTPFLYQGDELGLNEAIIPFDKLQDPWGKHLWPVWQGRDGCRTPIPWDREQPHAGFSDTQELEPWLPVSEKHLGSCANTQKSDKGSVLQFTQSYLQFRKEQTSLQSGDMSFLDSEETILSFERTSKDQSLLCIFNLDDQQKSIKLPTQIADQDIKQMIGSDLHANGTTLNLVGFGWAIINKIL